MANFLFWNIHRKDLTDQIVGLCREYDVDVLILAETRNLSDSFLCSLNKDRKRRYFPVRPQIGDIQIFHRFPENYVRPLYVEPQIISEKLFFSNIIIKSPLGGNILLCAMHLKSKLHKKRGTQEYIARQTMKEIRFYEAELSHLRTIIVGDLNMNPFEDGLTSFDSFHSVMDIRTALEPDREIYDESMPYFYNPMWRLMGDSVNGPPGTYYRRPSDTEDFFWHTFDQVLLRPSLIEFFNEDKLEIIKSIGEDSLLKENGRPDEKNFSDHLPIFFEIDIIKMEEEIGYGN